METAPPRKAALYVVNRHGKSEEVKFDRITDRLKPLCFDLSDIVDPVVVAQRVIEGLYPGVTTSQLDSLAAETAAYMSQMHPDFSILAARITVSNLHKMTSESFRETMEYLSESLLDRLGRPVSFVSQEVVDVATKFNDKIQAAIDYTRDFSFDYFAFKTLEKSYLVKDPTTKNCVERPQHLFMRVAIGIHGFDIDSAIETYNLMSQKWFTHATPTLFNSGTNNPQMSSCFLLSMVDDSIEGIYETLKRAALISKSAGGIGVSISNIRASGSYIKGTNGFSNGIVPMLRVFNDTSRYVDQGGGKRKGAFAIYLEPWHADVFDFVEMKKNHGYEERRGRDLFYALWIPDLFMKRVMSNGDWTLFCPNEAPELVDAYGPKFEELYTSYEAQGIGRSTVKAQSLWFKILECQQETGVPYMLYKDACNLKSNQKNLGTIKLSNLCTEIIEYTDADEVAVCNLASLSLPAYVKKDAPVGNSDPKFFHDNMDLFYDFDKLKYVTKVATKNLNKVIDRNFYPIEPTKTSNMKHRPIGLGVQGLADAFLKLRLSFESDQAMWLNIAIFETIYYAACEASMELAKVEGPYSTFNGSPASEGLLQFDLWNEKPWSETSGCKRHDWTTLKQNIVKHGLRNSLLVAPMPTASTAQILGNTESFEPYTQNIYARRVLSGEFVQINRHLVEDLISVGLWNSSLKQKLIQHKGSVQMIDEIPNHLKTLYKTVWEIKQKRIIDMAAARGPYIDQSQSLNIYMTDCNQQKLSSMHFYGWKKGLKTGQYYLRTQAAADAIQFTVDPTKTVKVTTEAPVCRKPLPGEDYVCESCSG